MTTQATVAPPRAAPPRENRTPRSTRIRSALVTTALLAGAGLDPFARLVHDPASERGFLEAHLLARLPGSPAA